MHPVFPVVAGYFVLGALGTWLANWGKPPEQRRQRWIKLLVYLLLVFGLLALMLCARPFFGLAALAIAAGGAWELVKVGRTAPRSGWFYLATALVFGGTATGFVRMAQTFDSQQLLYVFLIVFAFDGFCQIFGQLFGRRPLFPDTSPNKTVEGLAGGLAVAVLTAVLTRHWPEFSLEKALFVGLVLSAFALLGDWLASYYKRRHEVKDFSALIPGHGGVLDRFDSWLVAGAVAGLFF